ncbi:MAG: hypothetical protein R3C61_22020 [Bacteroidia bacterium]
MFGISPEKGARTSVYVAISPQVENITGKYFDKEKVARPSEKYYSPENEKRVWDYCQKVIEPYLS